MERKEIEDIPYVEVHEIEKYGNYYSENKFWKKIMRLTRKVGATVLRPVFQLYYMLQSDTVSLKHKAYILGALGYFVLPLDFIPDAFFSLIGFADDIAVMTLVISLVNDSLTPEIKAQAEAKLAELLHTTDI